MTAGLSVQDLLAGLPVATVVFSADGLVLAAGEAFWQVCGLQQPTRSLSGLGPLGSTLERIGASPELLEGQCSYRGPEGSLRVAWRHMMFGTNKMVVACLIREINGWLPNISAVSNEAASTTAKDLPNAGATQELLARALDNCAKQTCPLSIARIRVTTADNQSLVQVDFEAWRSIGRKLRAACRMSDLVGVAGSGDFLIILMNSTRQNAETVTHRIVQQLRTWCTASLATTVTLSTGFAAWTPGSTDSAAALFDQASDNCQAGQSA